VYINIAATNSLTEFDTFCKSAPLELLLGEILAIDNQEFTIGEDAILIADNIEQFNGSKIYISKLNTENVLGKGEYSDNLAESIAYDRGIIDDSKKGE